MRAVLQVAEHMLDPYGDDDEDFDLNFLLNRNAKVIELGTTVFTRDKIPSMHDVGKESPGPLDLNCIDSNKEALGDFLPK